MNSTQGRTEKRWRWTSLLLGLFLVAMSPRAYADIEIDQLKTVLDSFQVGIDLHTFYRADSNPYFGAKVPRTDGEDFFQDAHWGEVLAKIRLTAGKNFGWTEMLGQVSPFYALTADQDVYGLAKDDSDVGFDQAWIEFAKPFDMPVGVRIGRQDIQIEKWFVVGDGESEEDAIWVAGRYSFPFGVQVKADLSPVNLTAFYARPDQGNGGDIDLVGGNLHWDIVEGAYLYGGVYHKFDRSFNQDNDITLLDIGGEVTLLDSLVLEGEFAYQTGDAEAEGTDLDDREAFAWFASGAYTFPVDYSPFVRLMYVSYSGDGDDDDELEAWDPFFTGFIGWNRWVQGEQTAEVWLIQTNKNVIIGEVGFTPIEPMTVSLMYLNHRLDEKVGPFTGASLDSDKWGDEVNLFVDYQVNDHLFAHFGAGFTIPDDAAEEEAENIDIRPGRDTDETAFFAQLWLSFSL